MTQRLSCAYPGCPKTFTYQSRLDAHEAGHKAEFERVLECRIGGCNRRFNSEQHRTAHESTHAKYPCPDCHRSFAKHSLRKVHLESEHNGKRAHACSQCNKTFDFPSALTRHIKQVHNVQLRHFCARCDASFRLRQELLRHQRVDHKPSCRSCGRVFPESRQLREHELLHERPLDSRKVFTCTYDGCCKRYTKAYALAKHVTIKHDGKRLHACTQCGRRFAHAVTLRKHISREHEGNCSTSLSRDRVTKSSRSDLDRLVGAPMADLDSAADPVGFSDYDNDYKRDEIMSSVRRKVPMRAV